MSPIQKTFALAGIAAATSTAVAREHIDIVGSSTVYPFATVVAETFGKTTDFKTPKIESTGTGGGLKMFCQGVGEQTPDIANASRQIKASEIALCKKNGINDIVEVLVGYDGIAVANSNASEQMKLTTKDIFLALAAKVPGKRKGQLIDNPYKTWKDVNATLPDIEIEVLGPPPTSGTRDAFVELVMEDGCKQFKWIDQLRNKSTRMYRETCHLIRTDGAYIDTGENDNLIVQKLTESPDALGIFGYSFLEQNLDKVQGSYINGVEPNFDSIATGEYAVSRALYFYVKKAHVGTIPGIAEYIEEFVSNKAIGEDGYLVDKGLIPLEDSQRNKMSSDAIALNTINK